MLGLTAGPSSAAQSAITARDIGTYRLTAPVFRQFQQASGLIGVVTASDARFRFAPLFTREVAVSGDAPGAVADLVARIENDPPLASAVGAAALTAREYSVFALALFGARLAHGFVEAGVLRRVPAGAATENVAFVAEHQEEITAVLKTLGIDG